MTQLRATYPRQVETPKLSVLRAIWASVSIVICALWYFSELTVWHFFFFVALSAGLFVSYTRNILPLIVYFTMMLLYWVIVPFLQQDSGVGFYALRNAAQDFGPVALAFVFVHLAGLFVGGWLPKIEKGDAKPAKAHFSYLGVGIVLAIFIALMSYVGFDKILLPRVEQRGVEDAGLVVFLRNVAKLLPAFLLTAFVLEGRGRNGRLSLLVFVVLFLIVLAVANPVNTSRFLSLFGLAVIAVAYAIERGKLKALVWALAAIPIYAIALLAVTSQMRFGFDRVAFSDFTQSLRTLEFSSFAIFLDGLDMRNLVHDNYLVSHLLIVVPRDLWPAKSGLIGYDIAEASGYVFSNVGIISFFNAFADYGWVGLFLFSAAVGFAIKNLNPVGQIATFTNRRFMYGIILTATMPMMFRGDLSTAMLAVYAAVVAYETVRLLVTLRFKMDRRGRL